MVFKGIWLVCTGFKGIGDCTGRVEADTGACTGGDRTWYLCSISDGDIFGCEQGMPRKMSVNP